MAQTFNSIEEELSYWKDLAQRLTEERNTLQHEYEDYIADSRQLEKEYEITIEQNERAIRDSNANTNNLQIRVDNLQARLDQSIRDNELMQQEFNSVQRSNEKLKLDIRKLEQDNDNLERAQRVVTETVGAIEASLNNALERNAILESEIDDKEKLQEKLQRLADETRDLKQELLVRDREHVPDNERSMNGHSTTPLLDLNRLRIENETQTPIKTDPHNISLKNVDINALNAPLSPASRLLAMNIVGDIMRKVGSLETKLGRCRNCGVNNYKPENIRNHRSTRGSSPSIQGFAK